MTTLTLPNNIYNSIFFDASKKIDKEVYLNALKELLKLEEQGLVTWTTKLPKGNYYNFSIGTLRANYFGKIRELNAEFNVVKG